MTAKGNAINNVAISK